MPRTIGFETSEILEQAGQVFWLQGYTRTSMRALTDVTGLNPGSLYNHFGNKHDLFLAVCDHYYQRLTKDINASLTSELMADELLEQFFFKIIEQEEERTAPGCLLVNTLMECAQEPDIQAHIAAMFSGFEEMFYWILLKGQKQGTIRPGLNARAEAKSLVNVYYGIRVQGLTEATQLELRAIVEHHLLRFT